MKLLFGKRKGLSKIIIKKHVLMCTSILGLSTSLLMSQNVISPLSSEGSNKDVEVHLTAEEQNQIEQEKMLNTGNF